MLLSAEWLLHVESVQLGWCMLISDLTDGAVSGIVVSLADAVVPVVLSGRRIIGYPDNISDDLWYQNRIAAWIQNSQIYKYELELMKSSHYVNFSDYRRAAKQWWNFPQSVVSNWGTVIFTVGKRWMPCAYNTCQQETNIQHRFCTGRWSAFWIIITIHQEVLWCYCLGFISC